MIDAEELYVIQNTSTNGYWDGTSWRGILFSNKYNSYKAALDVVNAILNRSSGSVKTRQYFEIKKLYTL